MKPNHRFCSEKPEFWANVRLISQLVGYKEPHHDKIKVPTFTEIISSYRSKKLSTDHLETLGKPTDFAKHLLEYFEFRSKSLGEIARSQLMDVADVKFEFDKLINSYTPSCPLPMNKQKGDKKNFAFFTCIINMLIERELKNQECDYDPRELVFVTKDNTPIRTFSRRVDGCYPSTQSPIAIWEIKEYYYTTTFGSRVADGIYETLVDGMELEELNKTDGVKILHYLMIDSRRTWWEMGKSYLCRLVDMLHMGYVDEIFFGKEVISELPKEVQKWIELFNLQFKQSDQNGFKRSV